MANCFVIQPFDDGKFDKRYKSVFHPAISSAGVEPYRVDHDPSVSIPIQDIENGIRNSLICFADITLDNPNVWFELGFALATQRDVVLVCSDERTTKYPFDVQHRTILKYSTGAPQDFDDIKLKITERIKATLKKNESIARVITHPVVKDTEGLNQHELVALVTILQNSFLSNGYVPGYRVKNDMNKAFTDIAVAIALKTLEQKQMITSKLWEDRDESYFVYKATQKGEHWIITNQDRLSLVVDTSQHAKDNSVPF